MSGNVPSPAERLQAAADRIRDVAGKATPGSWHADGTEIYSNAGGTWVAETLDLDEPALGEANGGHIAFWDPDLAELVAVLLEGMGVHWATRPIADWNDYAITPLAALERHINGEEKP